MYKHKYWEKSESYRKEEKKFMCQERTLFPTSTQTKWERKIQAKLNPFFLRESDHLFFFIPGRLWPKKKPQNKTKIWRKKPAQTPLLGRILFVVLLLNCFWKQKNVSEIWFWKSHYKLMCSFGLKVTWQCVGLELCSKNLWYCPWQVGVCCATSVPGRAAGRRIFLLCSERQGKKFLPCLLLLWLVDLVFVFFFFPFSIPRGVICSWKYTAFFFKPTDSVCHMSNFGNMKNHICLKDIGT